MTLILFYFSQRIWLQFWHSNGKC